MFIFDADESRAMVLSTLAGLTTTLGGFIAVYKKPDARALAFLLGIAIGVMSSLSFIELYAKNVMEYGFLPVTASALAGAGLYACVAPCLPESRTQCWTNRSGLAERADDNKRDFEER